MRINDFYASTTNLKPTLTLYYQATTSLSINTIDFATNQVIFKHNSHMPMLTLAQLKQQLHTFPFQSELYFENGQKILGFKIQSNKLLFS